MNAGVEIILERIKTNPEEFCTKGGGRIVNGKWGRVIDNYSQHLNREDYDAIKNAIDKVQQDNFTEEVMTILVDGRDVASDEGKSPYLANVTASGGQTLGQSTGLTNGGFTLTGGAGTGATWANTAVGTTTINANSLTLGSTTISESTLKQLLDDRTLASKPGGFIKKHWWNKTLPELFGKK